MSATETTTVALKSTKNKPKKNKATPVEKKTPRMAKNREITPGVMRFAKAGLHRGLIAYKKLSTYPKKVRQPVAPPKFKTKPVGGDKNGKERKVPETKAPKFLPQVPETTTRIHRKSKKQPLRKSITPGTVLIVLVGRHRGKRVVFLKQLEKSGLLLVTGPLKLNATPLRRIAQAFVIATKTKVDLSGVELPEHINDDYFKKASTKKGDKSKEGIFATSGNEKEPAYVVSEQRKQDQKQVDNAILDVIRKSAEKKMMFGYLGSRFCLGKNQHPHQLVF